MKYLLSLVLFFLFSSCVEGGDVYLEAEVVEDEYELENMPARHVVKFKAVLSSGKKLSNIVLFESTVWSGWWQLLLDPDFENISSEKKHIDIDEYESLVSSILEYISKNETLGIDDIRINARLIDSAWKDIADAVKESSKSRKGKVILKDFPTARAISAAIQKSDVFKRTCALLGKYSYACAAPQLGGEDVAFQIEYYMNKSWKDVFESVDGGLSEQFRFSIDIKR